MGFEQLVLRINGVGDSDGLLQTLQSAIKSLHIPICLAQA